MEDLNELGEGVQSVSMALTSRTTSDSNPNLTRARAQRPTAHATHVAIVGAGFVGTSCAFAMLCKSTAAKVTLTDVNASKVEGEVLDLEDSGGSVDVATLQEAGQADVIVITAGRGQREGETRLDLIKANAGIIKSVVEGMQPIKPTAKIIVVSNPCDPLTYQAQQSAGLPFSQVFGSGTVLDSRRLRVDLADKLDIHHSSIIVFVLGEHGDSQFPVPSLANVGGVPLLQHPKMKGVDLDEAAAKSASKAYDIISRKGYTAFGVASACEKIVNAILNDTQLVLPVSVRVPGKDCCLSLPAVVGINGVEQIIDVVPHLSAGEMEKYNASVEKMVQAVATL